jgi:hypothetical protein
MDVTLDWIDWKDWNDKLNEINKVKKLDTQKPVCTQYNRRPL